MNRRLSLCLGAAVLSGSLLSAGLARADQPNMQNALSQLQAAKASLQAASHNKGGHRENAIRLINQAIVEVQLGIDVAR
jgi:outer membrane murein-binding lipoprotein Lpp